MTTPKEINIPEIRRKWGVYQEIFQTAKLDGSVCEVTMDGQVEPVRFFSGEIELEGLLWRPAADKAAPEGSGHLTGILACHPHPLYGGDMHNPLVAAICRRLRALGRPILRFNFRGTGMSDGVHDDGAGEQDDVRAAVDYLTSKTGGNASQVDFVGYSFGAWVGLRALTGDERVHRLVAVAPPVAFLEMSDAGQSGKPKLIVHGTRDEFAPADVLSSWIGSLPEPRQIVALEGADHFFFGFKDRVANEVTDYLRPLG